MDATHSCSPKRSPQASSGRSATVAIPTRTTSSPKPHFLFGCYSQAFFTLGPEDLAFVGGTRSERNRLALALLLVWARVERKLASDPAALPTEVVAFVAAQLGLSPDVLSLETPIGLG